MRRHGHLILVLAALGPGSCARFQPAAELAPLPSARRLAGPPPEAPRPARPAYPESRSEPVRDALHGVEVPDPYRWLEDEKAPQVQAWMEAQDRLARRELARLPGRDALVRRLEELYDVETLGVPVSRGGRLFYLRRSPGQDKRVLAWRQGPDGKERVLVDPNSWDGGSNQSLGSWVVAWDGSRLAYKVKENNSDEATLHLIDVATGERSLTDTIPGAKYGSPSWTPEGDGFYYTYLPTDPSIPVAERPGHAEIRFHRLGDDPARDRLVREATGDPKVFTGAELSRDGRYLVHTLWHGWRSTDVFFRDLAGSDPGAWRTLVSGRDARFQVTVERGRFYVLTNDGAPRGRVFRVDPARPDREDWEEIVPERPELTLDGIAVLGGQLVASGLANVVSRLEIWTLDGRRLREIPLPTVGSATLPEGGADSPLAYFRFTSFTHPPEVREVSIPAGDTRPWFRPRLPFDPEAYEVEQHFFGSRDGTRVSLFLVGRKGLRRSPDTPLLLYGYGGFQVSLTPEFGYHVVPWIERGNLYAVANLRGGSEYGEQWHRAGMLLEKENTFDDFEAAASYLIREGYTSPARLVIRGASNGGLLVGAALTRRPELFRAVLCGVPLLDMVRYHLFGSGKTWISEYGSADDAEQFRVLHAYSPYHHVTAGTAYPATLILSADHDDRVDPMHARKFAAALQAASSGGPVLLRIERQAGHGGADRVKASIEKAADEIAFALGHTGSGRLAE